MLNIVGERVRPNLIFGLHNVPAAHSFLFVKQDRSTSRRYMHWQNGEQVIIID